MQYKKRIYILSAWSLIVLFLVTLPMSEYEGTKITLYDKVVHVFMFGFFTYFLISVLAFRRNIKLASAVLLAFLFGVFYSAFAEFIQHFVPGRTVCEYDFYAGVFGAALFAAIAYLRFRREKPYLLLHICCVGCGAYVADLLRKEYNVVLFFYNPNIFPKEEYDMRLLETKRVAKKLGLSLIIGSGDHSAWLEQVRGHEKDPERGERCAICYYDRLAKTAQTAKRERIKYFTSTLSVSPHKDASVLSNIGRSIEKESGVKFIDQDFKKNNGYAESVKVSHDLKLYRQNYCGCEFSKR